MTRKHARTRKEEKRTGFGPHPRHKVSSQLRLNSDSLRVNVQPFFSTALPSPTATARVRIEKADRFWSAPSDAKPQASCGWRVTLCGLTCSHFLDNSAQPNCNAPGAN